MVTERSDIQCSKLFSFWRTLYLVLSLLHFVSFLLLCLTSSLTFLRASFREEMLEPTNGDRLVFEMRFI